MSKSTHKAKSPEAIARAEKRKAAVVPDQVLRALKPGDLVAFRITPTQEWQAGEVLELRADTPALDIKAADGVWYCLTAPSVRVLSDLIGPPF